MHVIWPGDIKNATLWYLSILRAVGQGMTLDELLERIQNDAVGSHQPSRRNLQICLYRMHQRGLIAKTGAYNTATYALNDGGLEALAKMDMRRAGAEGPDSWDGLWRLVLFDIPETKRESRYHIRRLLKELGFQQLQLSAWTHPLPLLEPFKEIQKAYGIEQHLLMLAITDFRPPNDIVQHFARRYPIVAKIVTLL